MLLEVQILAMDDISSDLIAEAGLLGDHAFHNSYRVIPPYSQSQIQVGDHLLLGNFNHSHSSDRMCSEHGIRFLKKWGIIRGRTDIRLFEDEEIFRQSYRAVWALHNYQVEGCPRI